MKNKIYLIILIAILCSVAGTVRAQYLKRDTAVVIDYSRTPREVVVKNIAVDGIPNFDSAMLVRLSGLTVGETISIPGDEITKAIKRYWKNGLFSNVAIRVDSILRIASASFARRSPPQSISWWAALRPI